MRAPPSESVTDRFLRYVRIDTQSQEGASTTPSTDKQWALVRLLAGELEQIGATDVRTSEHGMVYARIPGNRRHGRVPVIGFIAHVDTSPAVTRRQRASP